MLVGDRVQMVKNGNEKKCRDDAAVSAYNKCSTNPVHSHPESLDAKIRPYENEVRSN